MASEAVLSSLRGFVEEREWSQFHTPVNLAKSVAIEAGELLECFQWSEQFSREQVEGELADVLTYAYLLADRLGMKPDDLVLAKLEVTRSKYPVELSRGKSIKYDDLSD